MEPDLHPTAVVSPSARIGDTCKIGPLVVIGPDTEIGDGCRLEAHAVIRAHTVLGKENMVCEGAVLGGDPQDLGFSADTLSALHIGDGNIIRENVTIHRSAAAGGATQVGNRNFLMSGSHVAHDCFIGNQVLIASNTALAGHVTVEDRAFISGGVVIHQFSRVGTLAMVAGNAKVEKDVPPFCLADGVPARLRGLNLVGLRRTGFDNHRITRLKEAYRIICDTGLKKEEKFTRLAKLEGEDAQYLLQFLRASERGWLRAGE